MSIRKKKHAHFLLAKSFSNYGYYKGKFLFIEHNPPNFTKLDLTLFYIWPRVGWKVFLTRKTAAASKVSCLLPISTMKFQFM